jgi:hypothetical protein
MKSDAPLNMNLQTPVTLLLTNALKLSMTLNRELLDDWVRISFKLGTVLPASALMHSIQRVGRMDGLLRSMENEHLKVGVGNEEQDFLSFEAYAMLSEAWIGSAYEIFRIVKEQRHMLHTDLPEIARCLELVRVTLEKHQIAKDI